MILGNRWRSCSKSWRIWLCWWWTRIERKVNGVGECKQVDKGFTKGLGGGINCYYYYYYYLCGLEGFFFFRESFNLWCPLLIIALYYQTKIPISFWCKRGLNPRSLIQPSETLPVELTGTHWFWRIWLRWWWTRIERKLDGVGECKQVDKGFTERLGGIYLSINIIIIIIIIIIIYIYIYIYNQNF